MVNCYLQEWKQLWTKEVYGVYKELGAVAKIKQDLGRLDPLPGMKEKLTMLQTYFATNKQTLERSWVQFKPMCEGIFSI